MISMGISMSPFSRVSGKSAGAYSSALLIDGNPVLINGYPIIF